MKQHFCNIFRTLTALSRKGVWGCLLLLLLLPACKQGNLDMLGMVYTKSESADERFLQSEEWNSEHPMDTAYVETDNYRIYTMTDIHVDSTTLNLDTFTTRFMEEALSRYAVLPKPDEQTIAPFCFCLGDVINAVGNYPKFQAYITKIENAGLKVYGTPGNHDLYYDQWQIYRSYWHTSHFPLVVKTPSGKKDLFVFVDSSSGTLGKLQTEWLRSLLKEASGQGYRHIMICTHTHFWKKDQSQGHTSDFALEETYELADMFARNGVEDVIQGHSHSRDIQYFKHVRYVRLDAMEDHYYNAYYTIISMGRDINYEFVPVGPQTHDDNAPRVEGL